MTSLGSLGQGAQVSPCLLLACELVLQRGGGYKGSAPTCADASLATPYSRYAAKRCSNHS